MSKRSNADDVSNALFELQERVLCFHGPLIYEAKVIKIQMRDKEIHYLVHYAGWSKSWDEWVPEKRVLKWSDENLKKQDDLKNALGDNSSKGKKSIAKATTINKKKSIGGDSSSGNVSTTDSRSSTPILDMKVTTKTKLEPVKLEEDTPKRRKRNEFVEPEQVYEAKQEVEVVMPEQLKEFLVDDWDFITRQKRLANLPARHNINSILDDYLKWVKENNEDEEATAAELCMGLKEYFNVMVGNQLLYRYERQQFVDLEAKHTEEGTNPDLSSVYGAPHLLRLFTKLGGCLTYTTLDVDAIDIVSKCFESFLTFLQKNYNEYFTSDDYGAAPPEYQRKDISLK